MPDEQCFFILSPYDIVKAERRNCDDHIEFLISKKKFDEAIKALDKLSSRTDRPKIYTRQVRPLEIYLNRIIKSFNFERLSAENISNIYWKQIKKKKLLNFSLMFI